MASKRLTFRSVGQLIQLLQKVSQKKPAVWFRGQAAAHWKLQPSIMRPPYSFAQEVVFLKRFKQNAVPLIDSIPGDEADWLFLMQHHRVPTRLLDWTESPLVALYFAVAERKYDSEDAALWCLLPHSLNHLAGIRMDSNDDIPCFGHEVELDAYLPSRASGIKTASPTPVALIAPRPFRRLHVQQGVFTLFHRNTTALEELANTSGKTPHVAKLLIPAAAKPKLRKELDLLQLDRLALFPELENVADRILGLSR